MKKLNIPPYHVFSYRGAHLVCDVNTGRFMRIDEPTGAFLNCLSDGTDIAQCVDRLAGRYGREQCGSIASEVHRLRAIGLLSTAVQAPDRRDYERQIARLVRMSTGAIELYLAEACNLRCKYCYVSDNQALGNGLMPWSVAKAAVDLVFRRARGVPQMQITFFGGEPLLNKPVMRRVISYSQRLATQEDKKLMYSLTTNATLLDEEVIRYIKRYNFGLMISIDGPADVHNDMRPMANGGPSFDLVAKNVKKLMARRRSVTARCTVSNRHLDLPRIVTFLEDFGFTRVGLSRCDGKSYRIGEYDIGPEEYSVVEEYYEAKLDTYLECLERGELPNDAGFSSAINLVHKAQKASMLRCGVCRGCTTVGVNGSLYPCHRYVGMQNYVVGDVWRGVSPQKHGEYLWTYFATKEKCEKCWALHVCGGMCPWFVSHEDGASRPPVEWRCDGIKRSLERAAWLYDKVRSDYPEQFAEIVPAEDEEATDEDSGLKVVDGDGTPRT